MTSIVTAAALCPGPPRASAVPAMARPAPAIARGAEDRVVPPAQAEQIVDAIWERRLPHAYILYPGEDHGFRAAANIIRSFESELSFYGQVFGFEPADAIEPIQVEFLDGDPATAHRDATRA